ncbi:UDP-N-acetylmuramate dehydrogenase [Parasphingorhabdus cellanae]|uniref:UDP-N-acetylenolpyruvoylglucosamine reductase n=1 Tax=Parasphingorhabdus cellanae TaxID=2806553 RepID=A0ABX7T442_9SPHN|nr:UDP-N-acetylmuramate dehydrogenase [Parasphingorhabdus cellanae]QTD55567.1 UDP-N-acetylmuramate dehydrogenase [Parasphingorhabdus cellanae]
MTVAVTLPETRGKLTADTPLAPLVWFKSGGPAEWLFAPKDVSDLQNFLRSLPADMTVWPLGLGSNLIIRDGGKPGVTVRLGKTFAGMAPHSDDPNMIVCGAGAPGISAASFARDNALAGTEFLRGIPGTVGGAVRMNAGAYGREMCDILVSAEVVLRDGSLQTFSLDDMDYSYRYSGLPEDAIVVEATLRGTPGNKDAIAAEMKRIADEREASQPLRSKTGGSTFKNPEGHKAWQLVDEAGCRGLQIGQAQVSEKHCNFLLNLGGATSSDIEALGEEVRRRVKEHSGVDLQWEIQRVGNEA